MNEVWPDIYDEGCIHQFQPGRTHRIRLEQQIKFKDIIPWNISRMLTKTDPITTRIVVSCAVKRDFEIERKTTTWSQFPNGGKATVEQILGSGIINKSKRAEQWVSHSGILVRKLTIWVRLTIWVEVVWDRNVITVHQVYQFYKNKLTSAYDGRWVFKGKYISRWVDWENLIFVRWNSIKNCAQRRRRW